MVNCQNCGNKVLQGAKFCHHCGSKIVFRLEACPHCNTMNTTDAVFCKGCGRALRKANDTKNNQKNDNTQQQNTSNQKNKKPKKLKPYKAEFPMILDSEKEILAQIKTYFFRELRELVKIISKPEKYDKYVDVFYSSGFSYFFDIRSRELLNNIKVLLQKVQPNRLEPAIDQLMGHTFDQLFDRFTQENTITLNEWALPNTLKYENRKLAEINLDKLILDYLDVSGEEKIYTDFSKISPKKFTNAYKSFLFAEQDELVLALADQTVFGSCKEGFAFTNRGLYWKAHFNKAKKVYYDNILEAKKEQDWLRINGHYFHFNKKMNYKSLKLLRKLRVLHQDIRF